MVPAPSRHISLNSSLGLSTLEPNFQSTPRATAKGVSKRNLELIKTNRQTKSTSSKPPKKTKKPASESDEPKKPRGRPRNLDKAAKKKVIVLYMTKFVQKFNLKG